MQSKTQHKNVDETPSLNQTQIIKLISHMFRTANHWRRHSRKHHQQRRTSNARYRSSAVRANKWMPLSMATLTSVGVLSYWFTPQVNADGFGLGLQLTGVTDNKEVTSLYYFNLFARKIEYMTPQDVLNLSYAAGVTLSYGECLDFCNNIGIDGRISPEQFTTWYNETGDVSPKFADLKLRLKTKEVRDIITSLKPHCLSLENNVNDNEFAISINSTNGLGGAGSDIDSWYLITIEKLELPQYSVNLQITLNDGSELTGNDALQSFTESDIYKEIGTEIFTSVDVSIDDNILNLDGSLNIRDNPSFFAVSNMLSQLRELNLSYVQSGEQGKFDTDTKISRGAIHKLLSLAGFPDQEATTIMETTKGFKSLHGQLDFNDYDFNNENTRREILTQIKSELGPLKNQPEVIQLMNYMRSIKKHSKSLDRAVLSLGNYGLIFKASNGENIVDLLPTNDEWDYIFS
eukprot:TRINITY_DN7795_c0_g4_i1.p1 TRINITY_DN7795_c0_g4~~TRINITY_DN7795_c0_g4_i1.p1  ORF type:complete len:461 (-),score=77.81 TRINITY_DN7795_c0_g4_i1:30-1412(-)